MDERVRCLGLMVVLLGCGESVSRSETAVGGTNSTGQTGNAGTWMGGSGPSGGGGGASNTGSGGASVEPPSFSWTECGTIPSTTGSRTASYLPDGSAIVVVEGDGSAALWSPAENQKTRELRPPGEPRALAVSFDMTLVAEGGPALNLRRFDDGTFVRTLAPSECSAASDTFRLAFAASDRYVSTFADGVFCAWHVADGSLATAVPISASPVIDGDALVVWTGTEVVRYDLTGATERQFAIDAGFGEVVGGGEVNAALSPDGRYLATTAPAPLSLTRCALWDTADGALLWTAEVEERSADVGRIAFSPGGEHVSLCNSVRRRDGTLVLATQGAGSMVYPRQLSPDGVAGIAAVPVASMVGIVDLETGRVDVLGGPPMEPLGAMTGLAMSADGRTLASAGGAVLAWEVAPEFEKSRARYLFSTSRERPRVEISPDGRWIAVSGDGRVLRSTSGESPGLAYEPARSDPCWPLELRFSPDGQWLAGAGLNDSIEVFRMAAIEETGKIDISQNLRADCTEHDGTVRFSERVAFTANGEFLVTETGKRFRTRDWRQVSEGSGKPVPHLMYGSLELSPTGESILSDCDVVNGGCSPYPVAFPKFSPDGSMVIAGGLLYGLGGRTFDPDALVGTFAPNGDVIVAHADNSITRYCRSSE